MPPATPPTPAPEAPVRIGISGWRYDGWQDHFYPPKLAQARELAYASRQFNSLEINGSFYALQRPGSYARWAAETPPGFVFSLKASRYITHVLQIRHARSALANFFASGLFALGDKLGPILWQFPPSLAFDPEGFADFFDALPRDTDEAARLASQRDERMQGRELLEPVVAMHLRHAVDVRHKSFADPAFIALLRHHGIAWVVADAPRPWPQFDDLTADFVYLRLHGPDELYGGRYSPAQLAHWAGRIKAWRRGGQPDDARLISAEPPPGQATREVFCYFNNTDKRHAPENAREMMATLGLQWAPPPAEAAPPRRR